MNLQNLIVLVLLVGTTYAKFDCLDWYNMVEELHKAGYPDERWEEGTYTLSIGYSGNWNRDVMCEGEGWMVIQKRYDGSLDYNQTLEEYGDGFGSAEGEYFLGLIDVHHVTKTDDWTLRIELQSFDNEVVWAEYTGFSIGEAPGFILNFDESSYSGTAGDSLDRDDPSTNGTLHRGMKFTTFDQDQDKDMSGNCAERYGGAGWWYNDCLYATTTGMPYENGMENSVGISKSIYWHMWKGHDRLKAVTMKIRRN